jgi:hypothetical protein
MAINIGNDNISDIYIGADKISDIYIGSELVYTQTPIYTPGMRIWYDGIKNYNGGHDISSAVWSDLSGNGTDAQVTLSGGDAWTDNGIQINNNGTRIRVNYDLWTRPCTIEFALVVSSNYNYGTLAFEGSDRKLHGSWIGSDGRVVVRVQSSYNAAATVLTTSELHTVTIVLDGNTQRVYIDGVSSSISSKTWANSVNTFFDIFATSITTSRHIRGVAHSFRYYSSVLTDEQIAFNHTVDVRRFGE